MQITENGGQCGVQRFYILESLIVGQSTLTDRGTDILSTNQSEKQTDHLHLNKIQTHYH